MVNFDEFFRQLTLNPSISTKVSIFGQEKTIKAMSLLTSLNYQDTIGNYYKIVFSDDSILIVIPKDQQIQYSPGELGKIESISNNDIGQDTVSYNGNTFNLVNKNDYQFVLKKIVGGLLDMEGECKFSDYVNSEDENDCLSLGSISYDGRRADVNAKTLSINDINVIN